MKKFNLFAGLIRGAKCFGAGSVSVASGFALFGIYGSALASPTDDMLEVFGIKTFAEYQSDLATLETMGVKADVALATNSGPGWFDYWKELLAEQGATASSLASVRYYVRGNPVAVTNENYETFDNVQRVKRILTKEKFEALFPNSTGTTLLKTTDLQGEEFQTAADAASASVYWHKAGTAERAQSSQYFSYENFLKAVALLPGLCGSYADYPDEALRPWLMARADLIARKTLAMIFAHAVQETSNTGVSFPDATPPKYSTLSEKLPGTFADIVEIGGGLYPDVGGVFSIMLDGDINKKGSLYPLTLLPGGAMHEGRPVSHAYCGRGIKQTSYPSNYANASLFLFGDLRLLAHPELIEEPGLMGFLSGLYYSIQPKESNPSILEIMDGTFHRKLEELALDPAIGQDPEFLSFKQTYDQEFPLTVLLVNGGPECNGNPNLVTKNNTKIRIAAYNYFVTTNDLLEAVNVEATPATTPSFTPLDPGSVTGDQFIPANGDVVSNAFYNLTGNQETCQLLMIGTVNDIAATDTKRWRKMFARPVYFGPNWESKLKVQISAWQTLPVYGGKAVHETMTRAFPSVDSDSDSLTDEAEVIIFGSNPYKASTFEDGLTDGEKYAIGLSPGTDHALAINVLRQQGEDSVVHNPVDFGLYSAANIADLNLGGLMLEVNGGRMATLHLQLQATADLSEGFSDLGEAIEVPVELPSDKYFLRVRALGQQ